MTEFVIYKQDHKKKENVVMCRGNCDRDFLEFMQYALDNMSDPETLILENLKTHVTYDAYRIATEHFDMRKRTFDERMAGTMTAKLYYDGRVLKSSKYYETKEAE